MEIISRSLLPSTTCFWQPRPDRWICTVICKATYYLRPDLSPFASEQDPLQPGDVHWANDDRRSLMASGDEIPFKRFPEVLLIGSAHAAGGIPLPVLHARIEVGSVRKVIEVVGDRFLMPAGALTAPAPFVRMPLVWERAAGGPGTYNPVGMRMGAAALPDAWGRVPVPNLQLPGRVLTGQHAIFEPVGFGPIAAHWPTRAGRLPFHARGWDVRRWNEHPLPAGFDPWFFNAAPEDQQLPDLRPDERIVLEHLHSEYSYFETTLERLTPQASVRWMAGGLVGIELRCDTLVIDTDSGHATLTWRGHVPLEHPRQVSDVMVNLDRADMADRNPAAAEVVSTVILDPALLQNISTATLPFTKAPDRGEVQDPCAPVSPQSPLLSYMATNAAATLPAPLTEAKKPLPFQPVAADGLDDEALTPRPPPALPATASALAWAPPDSPPETLLSASRTSPPEEDLASTSAPHVLPPPEPPPLIGPLAHLVNSRQDTPELPSSASARQAEEPAEPALGALDLQKLADYPIERCASIAASLARQPDRAAEILRSHRLDHASWEAIRRRWDDAIKEETSRGHADLLHTYDAAFVGQIERERGPITPEHYAHLVVAAERGRRHEALAALELPREAVLPIERIYLRRTVQDPTLRSSVRSAIAMARHG